MVVPKLTAELEPQVAQLNIGELLAEQRHQHKKSIAEVASSVRLAPSVIEKLEKNEFSSIGTAVYVRGYLGIYAKYLGIDAAYLIDQYNQQYPAEEVVIRPSAGQSAGAGRRHSKRHSKTLSFLVAGLVTGSLVYGYNQVEPLLLATGLVPGTTTTAPPTDANTTAGNNTGVLTTVIDGVDAANNLADDALNGVPLAGADALVTDIELDLATSNAAVAAENDTSTQNPPTAKIPALELESAKTTENAENTADSAKIPQTAKLHMAFTGDCWVKITDANNKTLTSRLYKKGRKLNVQGTAPLNMVLGAPDAVHSATLNGKPMQLSDYKVGRIKYRLPAEATTNQ